MTFEYAPALESRSIVSIKAKHGHFINGSFVAGKKHFPTINPATEEILSHIALGGASDVDKAVLAAGFEHHSHIVTNVSNHIEIVRNE